MIAALAVVGQIKRKGQRLSRVGSLGGRLNDFHSRVISVNAFIKEALVEYIARTTKQ